MPTTGVGLREQYAWMLGHLILHDCPQQWQPHRILVNAPHHQQLQSPRVPTNIMPLTTRRAVHTTQSTMA
eukprot:6454953-Amphidinium_carterae.1